MAEAEGNAATEDSFSDWDEDDVEEVNNNAAVSPWPYLDQFMVLKNTYDTTFVFKCLLCQPKHKLLKTSKTSSTNLRTHIKVS